MWAVLFLVDNVADTRELWRFSKLQGLFILSSPLENNIFVILTIFNILALYTYLRVRIAGNPCQLKA